MISPSTGLHPQAAAPIERAAMAKGDRIFISLRCRECQSHTYHTTKNRRNDTDRLELTKYCPRCRARQAFRETR